jgi:dipeptidyl aminopeptidase/acylaminoacyl peptidase
MGHSMGASIAPIAMAFEPRFEAMIVSGAGASWIENIIYKESPLPTRPIAEALLGYTGRRLREDDPVLSLLQWSDEEADAAVYAPIFSRDATSPRNVLVFQGVRDTYIPPEVANPLTLALGIDVVSPVIEPSVIDALSLTARQQIPFPASLNLRGATAALVQHEEDGIEDGHEILWQRADARMQMGCFLRTLRDEGAVIANATALPAACTR